MKKILFILLIGLYIFCDKNVIYASEISEDIFDYSEIQDFIDSENIGDEMDFGELVSDFLTSDTKTGSEKLGTAIKENLFAEISINLKAIKMIIAIVIIMAVFSEFACIVKTNQTSEMGFMISYIMIMTGLTVSFGVVSLVAYEVVGVLVDFMKSLLPVYLVSITIVNGQVYATGYCEMVLVVMAIMEIVCLKVILPAINLYVMVGMVNNIAKEDVLSKTCEFIGSIVNFLIKAMFAGIVGLNIFQKLIEPMSIGISSNTTKKIVGTISGMTSFGNGISELIAGTGNILKNAIGAAGFVVLCVVVLVPLIKILVFKFSYQLTNALVQPISDKRINNCLTCISTAADMLIKVVFGNFLMFMITITLICIT